MCKNTQSKWAICEIKVSEGENVVKIWIYRSFLLKGKRVSYDN